MKATFDISLAHHKMYSSISNMPQKESKNFDKYENFVIDTYDTTVPMSTYLVAYCVSDFEYKEASTDTKDDVKFRIYARRDAMNQVDYAAEVGPKVLKFYEDYFKIKFPLPKIDMIAVPDFSAGAMEVTFILIIIKLNYSQGILKHRTGAWLLTVRLPCSIKPTLLPCQLNTVLQKLLLMNWRISGSETLSQCKFLQVHLVNPTHVYHHSYHDLRQWWTDLWLNEGFATYVASLGVAHLHPEWHSLDEESVDNTLDIFKFDALKSSHPVSVEIGHPNQISQIFDAISYSKGSVIIRMMHKFLGEKSFQDGVSNYLKKHEYANAKQDDLWNALTEVAHSNQVLPNDISVKDIMDTWTLQVGYPIVHVRRNYDTNSAELSQMRYLSDRLKTRSDTDACWWIPLTYTDSENLDFNASHVSLMIQ